MSWPVSLDRALSVRSRPPLSEVPWDRAADLDEHRGLIPIDVLVRDLAVLETDDNHQSSFNPAISRRNSRQHPIHFDAMCELEAHSLNKLVRSDRPRPGDDLQSGGHLGDEVR